MYQLKAESGITNTKLVSLVFTLAVLLLSKISDNSPNIALLLTSLICLYILLRLVYLQF